jgi:hypothetical protein
MEKQTKILLGLAAVVVAYLVLRPKEEAVGNAMEEVLDCNKVINENRDLFLYAKGLKPSPAGDDRAWREKQQKDAIEKINELGLNSCFQEYMSSQQKGNDALPN